MPLDEPPELAPQMRAAHRRLQDLCADVQDTLAEELSHESARKVFGALRDSLDVHFEQEDRLYYPAIRSLRPDLTPQVTGFAEQHDHFRRCLAAIDSLLGAADRAGALSEFVALIQEFGLHEAAEEDMLAEVDREPAATG